MNLAATEHVCDMERQKQVAAEHIAIELGLLRDCPHHGGRFRVRGKVMSDTSYCAFATYDPILPLFRGDVDDLLIAVEAAVTRHAPVCVSCA